MFSRKTVECVASLNQNSRTKKSLNVNSVPLLAALNAYIGLCPSLKLTEKTDHKILVSPVLSVKRNYISIL